MTKSSQRYWTPILNSNLIYNSHFFRIFQKATHHKLISEDIVQKDQWNRLLMSKTIYLGICLQMTMKIREKNKKRNNNMLWSFNNKSNWNSNNSLPEEEELVRMFLSLSLLNNQQKQIFPFITNILSLINIKLLIMLILSMIIVQDKVLFLLRCPSCKNLFMKDKFFLHNSISHLLFPNNNLCNMEFHH